MIKFRQYCFNLTDGYLFSAVTIVYLSGGPVIDEPVYQCDISDAALVDHLIGKMFETPVQYFPNILARDHRRGEAPLMSKYSKYKTYKSFGLHSLEFGVRLRQSGEWSLVRKIGDGKEGWEDDYREGSRIILPAGTAENKVQQTLLKMIFQARDNWQAEHPAK